jgi:hypothetical protein
MPGIPVIRRPKKENQEMVAILNHMASSRPT